MHRLRSQGVGVAVAALLAMGGRPPETWPEADREAARALRGPRESRYCTFESDVDIAFEAAGEVTQEASHMTTKGTVLGRDTAFGRYVETWYVNQIQYRSYQISDFRMWALYGRGRVAPEHAHHAHRAQPA